MATLPNLLPNRPESELCTKKKSLLQERFGRKGTFILKEDFPPQYYFEELYRDVDAILDQIKCDPYLSRKLKEASNKWISQIRNKGFWGDLALEFHFEEIETSKHRDELVVTIDFISFFEKNYQSVYANFPLLKIVHRQILWINEIIERKFKSLLYDLERSYSGVTERICGFSRNLPIAYRLIRYHSSESYASALHFDKSAMSILLNNTDRGQESKQVLAVYKEKLNLKDLKAVRLKNANNDDRTSALVIPGLGLEAIGVDIMPTPHAVLPFVKQGCYRHAFVAYLMVPYTIINSMTSKILVKESKRLGKFNGTISAIL